MQHTQIRARHSDCEKAGAGGILGHRSILVLVAVPVQALVLALVLAVLLEKHCTTGFELLPPPGGAESPLLGPLGTSGGAGGSSIGPGPPRREKEAEMTSLGAKISIENTEFVKIVYG